MTLCIPYYRTIIPWIVSFGKGTKHTNLGVIFRGAAVLLMVEILIVVRGEGGEGCIQFIMVGLCNNCCCILNPCKKNYRTRRKAKSMYHNFNTYTEKEVFEEFLKCFSFEYQNFF